MEYSLAQIAALLDGVIDGDGNRIVRSIGKLEAAGSDSISFLSNAKYEPHLYHTRAAGVIVSRDFNPKRPISATLIRVDDPYISFTALLEEFHKLNSFRKTGIEQPCHTGEGTTIGKNSYIGAFAYIGDHVTIGDNVRIYPHSYIGDGSRIGNNTVVFAGAKVYERSIIGSYCTIQAGAVIGSHGFGFARQPDGTYKNIPQVGNVILEDHVDIGANTTIDCATFESTIIRRGVKIDNLVQVAHNVEIGANTVIAAQTGISGSTKIGKQVIIGGQVGTVGHIRIMDGTVVGAKSGISKSVTKKDQVLFGELAFDHGKYMRSYVIFKKLPEVMERIRELEQKILNLPQA